MGLRGSVSILVSGECVYKHMFVELKFLWISNSRDPPHLGLGEFWVWGWGNPKPLTSSKPHGE